MDIRFIFRILEYPLIKFDNFTLTPGRILLATIIIIGAIFLQRFLTFVIKKRAKKSDITDEGGIHSITKIIKYFLYTIATVLAIQSLGVEVGILLASSAALFVGIGFGLQNIFNDMVSGLILLFEAEIKKGDILEIDGTVGRVESIDIRTSKIFTRDGIRMIIPNSHLTSQEIINWSYNDQMTRFKITVGVAYGSDTKLVTKILQKCAEEHPEVSNTHPVRVRFIDFGDSALIFELFFWAQKTWEIEWIRSELRYQIDNEFRKAGVQIPFPQRDLHLISDNTKKD